jgi:hypothetical protein
MPDIDGDAQYVVLVEGYRSFYEYDSFYEYTCNDSFLKKIIKTVLKTSVTCNSFNRKSNSESLPIPSKRHAEETINKNKR